MPITTIIDNKLYVQLDSWVKEGMITASLKIQEKRPGKKVFSLTEEGRKAFMEWIQQPSGKIRDVRTEFLAKLYIIYKLNLGIGKRLIETQIEVCRNRREFLTQNHHGNDSFESLVRQYRLTTIDATIQWLQDCRRLFEGVKDA